jgi:hypothetical protein
LEKEKRNLFDFDIYMIKKEGIKMKDKNKSFENEILQQDDKFLKDIEEKIKEGEFSTNSIFIDSIIDDEEMLGELEELEEDVETDDFSFSFEKELDFENGVIEGFDMKKFNEEFNKGVANESIQFIEDLEGLSSVIENIDKYKDKVEESSPGLFVFKTDKKNNEDNR